MNATPQAAPLAWRALIGGNKYRLVAAIAYAPQLVWVKAVLTHAEYDKGAWK